MVEYLAGKRIKGTSSERTNNFDPNVVFDYTGSDQTYTVPSGVSTLKVHIWGAGGQSVTSTTYGGAGGYTYGEVSVSSGQTIKVVVGAGGEGVGINSSSRSNGYGGGGDAGAWYSGTHYGAGYGGIFTNTVSHANSILIAGGGGLSGNFSSYGISKGGGGGGSSGGGSFSTSSCQGTKVSGGGGTQSAAGTHYGSGTSPSALQGGGSQGAGFYSYGGGGGGYYGGGAGDTTSGSCGSAGSGGGSGYIGGNATHTVSNGVTTKGDDGATSQTNPPQTANSFYNGTAGKGANSATYGGDALVVFEAVNPVNIQDGTIFEETDTNKAYIWNASTSTWSQL